MDQLNNNNYRKIKKSMKKVSLVVIRIGRYGDIRDSTPCQRCMEAMKMMGIKKIAYSDYEGKIVEKRVRDLVTRGPSKTQQRLESNIKILL